MNNIPTSFQKRSLWTALTAVSLTVVGVISIALIYLGTQVLAFLQPILVPFAVAGVLAYLLEPGVVWLERRGLTRHRAVLLVFAAFFTGFVLLGFWLVPQLAHQSANLAKNAPDYAINTSGAILRFVDRIEKDYGVELLPRTTFSTKLRNEIQKVSVRRLNDATRLLNEAKDVVASLQNDALKSSSKLKHDLDAQARSLMDETRKLIALTPTEARVQMINLLDETLRAVDDLPTSTDDVRSSSFEKATKTLEQLTSLIGGEKTRAAEALQKEPTEDQALAEPILSGHVESPPNPEKLPISEEELTDQKQRVPEDFDLDLQRLLSGDWVWSALPSVWNVVKQSFGGFLGVFGFVLSMIIVPLYLYYFLIESARIKETWSNYLPLRASAFKNEVVDCLTEINGYLIAFFRGQLFVSLINGVSTGLGLMIVGLEFGLLIGLMLCVLGIIPYLGIALCWIPAVVIAAVQGGSGLVPGDPWWVMPLVVTGIFTVVQQVDGFFISPKIVGESVGLHPMTVIVSVFAWSLLLGGLLGAILAVPLTASVKVLFQRYVWLARLAPQTIGGARETGAGKAPLTPAVGHPVPVPSPRETGAGEPPGEPEVMVPTPAPKRRTKKK